MLIGLVQFQLTRHYLGESGVVPLGKPASWLPVTGFVVVLVVVVAMALTGQLQLNPVIISKVLNWVMLAMAAGYFLYLLAFAGLDASERKRVIAIIALFSAWGMFW